MGFVSTDFRFSTRTLVLVICLFHLFNHAQLDFQTDVLNGDNSATRQPLAKFKDSPDLENHKPMFTDCATYNPSVLEQQPRGTKVIQVHADDVDPKDKKGGKVSYDIVMRPGEREYFKIDNNTGQITTNTEFDRDEPLRQKEFYLSIRATDDGRPPLADICSFKVTIKDINDNTPNFDVAEYKAQVSEDTKKGSEVMRVFAYDFDESDNARLTYSFSKDTSALFNQYFRIDPNTGVVYLKESLKGDLEKKFTAVVEVHDNGEKSLSTTADLSVIVVGSDKRQPSITVSEKEIVVPENNTDYDTALVEVTAESNIDDKRISFELIKGKTPQTNKDNNFALNPTSNNTAIITLARYLDYETVTEYQLTVRVLNKDGLATTVNIIVKVTDVNDEIPTFIELIKGSVVENDVAGAQAMTVRAVDKDGTSPFNLVRYELQNNEDVFMINQETGLITTRKGFDRETESLYYLDVRAYDGAPSAILKDKTQPNSVTQTFQIRIEDQNDNKPSFTKALYVVHNISESSDKMKDVIEIRAEDKDIASLISYSIIEGNIGNAFMIEEATGRIKVNEKLDFEKIESYNLTVKAFDGLYDDTTKVIIFIQNENDELPVFEPYNKNITMMEETLSNECIITLKAYDPDIKDRSADQRIVYRVLDKDPILSVTNDGCVEVIKKLDRDLPNGAPQYQGFIHAYDNGGSQSALKQFAEINIILEDMNDNAPILNMTEVVWVENQEPGVIVGLMAIDYDSPANGPPFIFEIAPDAYEIKDLFSVTDNILRADVTFDREKKKFYDVPIKITDSGVPPQSGISTLRVIIGDRNDNAAKDGSSEIFVYKYQGLQTDIDIGRVFVEDLDDWDLYDKIFQPDVFLDDNFILKHDGMIVMKKIAAPGQYKLNFRVTEESPNVAKHEVRADVTVTVKEIPEEAVRKSGSIRIAGSTIEEFVEKDPISKLSKKDLLQRQLAKSLNTSLENVDVFTVLKSPHNNTFVDVRFSAHGSPFYAPEKLNSKASREQELLEQELGVDFKMIGINECLREDACSQRNSSCTNILNIADQPAVVFTNKTSFVGVKAIVEATCECSARVVKECFNGGSPIEEGCSCPEGYEGPHCEILGIGFSGDGWALYPGFDACNYTEIVFSVLPKTSDGLIFYVGPLTRKHAEFARSFMSLELRDGLLALKYDLGSDDTTSYELVYDPKKLNDDSMHKVKIVYTTNDILINVDDSNSDTIRWKNLERSGLLKINGPLQMGGRQNMFTAEESKTVWQNPPTTKGFVGCITNFTYNGHLYNLGAPSDSHHAPINCNYGVMQAVTFGIDSNFLVAILVCVAILLILLLVVVVHKRKQDKLNEKDMDDTRENIINYEDEGGGECDASDFDLRVLRQNPEEKLPVRDNIYRQGTDVPADISSFLDNKKTACDKDNLPYDDVRHYGYEGDGNTSGSLSSLASCTDDGDLKFNYLSSFGPRFRKLADMYGDDASEEGSQTGGEESWC